ncbi:MAG: hypothetical protein Q9162_005074 [Coniocarpon cinnabarinum]
MSHLPAQDLLTVKLVSRRFYALVTSPTAWSNAFSKYFPGPESLQTHTLVAAGKPDETFHSEARVFTRLSASTSWSSEYLTRTRLFRALMRGRPSLPFAAPCPGKPGKGSATFTFSSRIWQGCTALDADFGSIFDKRKPQFIHGSAMSGSVLSSDRRGKFDAWGFSNPVFFRHFHEIHPGVEPYGMGAGTCVGVPNMLEVSQHFGMLYGEGTPGGNVHFLGVGEKHARLLTSFSGLSYRTEGVPFLLNELQCPTALWIAKSTALPRTSQGMIGILVGSSNGTVTSYSLGPQGGQRYERGEMTARWTLSPGVPIIAVCADDHFNEDRMSAGRVWGFALTAIGELFYITSVVEPAAKPQAFRNATPDEVAEKEELRAWQTGLKSPWHIVSNTIGTSRYEDGKDASNLPGIPTIVGPNSVTMSLADETSRLQPWFGKSPAEIRSEFDGWNMRRKLLVDFAGDDGGLAGESGVIFTSDVEFPRTTITRWKRSKLPAQDSPEGSNQRSDAWLQTTYSPGGIYTLTPVTAIGSDNSMHATTTLEEDESLRKARLAARHGRAPHADTPSKTDVETVPGRRARLFAAGTASGFVLVWDLRAPTAKLADLTNDVQPVRVIVTDSPGIASVALSSLYLVHGGTEGLLQAWDLLASTTDALRTLSSRRFINNRRRAIIAAQQASVPATWATQNNERLAASAICLDPDPHVLRGVATIDSWIKYWSFSSASSAEEMSRSQKRKLKKGNGSKNPNFTGGGEADMGYSTSGGQRRTNLKSYVSHELHQRELDQIEQRRASKQDRRFAGRFGMDLLGADASEADMIAYAKLLSQEENEKQLRRAAESTIKLSRNASTDEVEAHKASLNDRDAENWKYASWRQRFEMLPEGGVALPREMLEEQSQSTPATEDPDVKRAMELSLQEERERQASSSPSMPATPLQAGSSNQQDMAQLENDPDLAEAIALSMTQEENKPSSSSTKLPPLGRSAPRSPHLYCEDDDLSRAIRASLADRGSSSPPEDAGQHHHANENDFPSLASSSPPSGTASGRKGSRGKGKEVKHAW